MRCVATALIAAGARTFPTKEVRGDFRDRAVSPGYGESCLGIASNFSWYQLHTARIKK